MNLKKLFVFLFICRACILFAQTHERFTENWISESWQGDNSCFVITSDQRLQLKAPKDLGQSCLSTSSTAISDAEWQLYVQLNFNPSSTNYARFYLCSDNPALKDSLNGYYLQIGNASDQILLYKQTGKTSTKIGESGSDRVNMDTVRIKVKIQRDNIGNWTVWSRKLNESDFFKEFSCTDNTFEESSYAGIFCRFTTTRNEHFLFDSLYIDGDIVRREPIPEMWQGEDTCFIVAPDQRIQLKAPKDKGESYLSTSSDAISDAEWKLSVQMNFNPSGTNYARFYVCSDNPALSDSLNGYYLQIGNASDQILFYRQSGMAMKKLGESTEKRVDMDTVRIDLKVQRDDAGNWTVWSKKPDEPDFTEEFSCTDDTWEQSFFAGFYSRFTTTRNEHFLFDAFHAEGEAYLDLTAPDLHTWRISENTFVLHFSEPMDTTQFLFNFEENLSFQTEWSKSRTTLSFYFESPLESGKKYTFYPESMMDLSGNTSLGNTIYFGIAEPVSPNDIILNEVLFYPFAESDDYVEIYNRSNKVIDLSTLNLATRRSDETLYSAKSLSSKIHLFFPDEYLVLTTDKDIVCNFYDCLDENAFLILEKLPVYGNEKGCVVLTNKEDDEVIDEFNYTSSMHNEFVKEKQGVSLERQSPESDTWQSASESSGFGTPGYKNSQHTGTTEVTTTTVKLENEVCFPYGNREGYLSLRYSFEQGGYTADISVFSVNGQRVRRLGESMSLSTEGTICWDGKDDNGRVVPVAPYIILFEAFHPKGDIFKKSFVGVVSK